MEMEEDPELDFLLSLKDPEARATAAGARWLRGRGAVDAGARGAADLLAEKIREAAWNHPDAIRMTLVLVRGTHGWDRREIAKILGVSIFEYNLMELGRRPMCREDLEKVAAAKEISSERLEDVLLTTHALNIDLSTAWERNWQETLAPLTPVARRARILEDRDLQNWGLGELICDKSMASRDPDDAVALAELALLVAEREPSVESFRQRTQGYAWGHLGHALKRRGNQAAAEEAFAECIRRWSAGEGVVKRDARYAERLAAIVPGFPPYEPRPARRKAKGASASRKRPERKD